MILHAGAHAAKATLGTAVKTSRLFCDMTFLPPRTSSIPQYQQISSVLLVYPCSLRHRRHILGLWKPCRNKNALFHLVFETCARNSTLNKKLPLPLKGRGNFRQGHWQKALALCHETTASWCRSMVLSGFIDELGFRVSGFRGFRVLGFRGLGFRAEGFEIGVFGFGIRVFLDKALKVYTP